MKWLLFILSFIAIERFCHEKTHGFRPHKIASKFAFDLRWECEKPSDTELQSLKKTLSQPYHFLGSGGQSYAFVSADGKSVIKFFKAHHMRPLKLPFCDKLNEKREQRLEAIFGSCHLAFANLKEETGLIAIHLNKTDYFNQKLTLVDAIGIAHTIDLDKTEFVLQKRAEMALPKLDELMATGQVREAENFLDSTLELILARAEKGIADGDPIMKRNLGCLNGKAMYIDLGSFLPSPDLKQERAAKRTLFFETRKLQRWLHKHHRELEPYFEKKLHHFLKFCYTISSEVEYV